MNNENNNQTPPAEVPSPEITPQNVAASAAGIASGMLEKVYVESTSDSESTPTAEDYSNVPETTTSQETEVPYTTPPTERPTTTTPTETTATTTTPPQIMPSTPTAPPHTH